MYCRSSLTPSSHRNTTTRCTIYLFYNNYVTLENCINTHEHNTHMSLYRLLLYSLSGCSFLMSEKLNNLAIGVTGSQTKHD